VVAERRPGLMILNVTGDGAAAAFAAEAGGHRWQRIPPTERSGRVHSSTVTVAVLAGAVAQSAAIPAQDLQWRMCRGSGPGGQHRNKTESAVEVTHIPTGLRVRCDRGRRQGENKVEVLEILRERLQDLQLGRAHRETNAGRQGQIGSGQRGDKIRTVQVQHDAVRDHRNGQRIKLDEWIAGRLEGLL
jgi:peptide chain release factor 1